VPAAQHGARAPRPAARLQQPRVGLVAQQHEQLGQLRGLGQRARRWRQRGQVRRQRRLLARAALPDAPRARLRRRTLTLTRADIGIVAYP